jgi:hypothetical protein
MIQERIPFALLSGALGQACPQTFQIVIEEKDRYTTYDIHEFYQSGAYLTFMQAVILNGLII